MLHGLTANTKITKDTKSTKHADRNIRLQGWRDAGHGRRLRGRAEIENTSAPILLGRLCSRSQRALNRVARSASPRLSASQSSVLISSSHFFL